MDSPATMPEVMDRETANRFIAANSKILLEKAEGQKSFKEIVGFCKGSVATLATFLATNGAAVLLKGASKTSFETWLRAQRTANPGLKGVINVFGDVVKFSWNQLVSNPNLCAIVISGLIAAGAIVAYNIKKKKLKRELKSGKAIVTENGVYRKV